MLDNPWGAHKISGGRSPCRNSNRLVSAKPAPQDCHRPRPAGNATMLRAVIAIHLLAVSGCYNEYMELLACLKAAISSKVAIDKTNQT